MLLQQAQVAGFDGGALQLAFEHAGTRDGFVNGGHDDILRQALQESVGVSCKIECLIGPGGSAPQQRPGGGGTPGGGFGANGGFGAPSGPAPGSAGMPPHQSAPVSAPAPAAFPPPTQTAQAAPPVQAPPPSAPAPRPSAPSSYPEGPDDDDMPPPPFDPEEDIPEQDTTTVSGHDLIIRELGATVIEETHHER
jgi:DNA polymerase-3 subunit gamma/tau